MVLNGPYWILHALSMASLFLVASSWCYDPQPALPVPDLSTSQDKLSPIFADIGNSISSLAPSNKSLDTTSISVSVTGLTSALWSYHHTGSASYHGRGVKEVDGDSVYLVGSITKTFTVLALLLEAEDGTLRLDDLVTKYVPELLQREDGDGGTEWDRITLRSLANQLSGISREYGFQDVMTSTDDPTWAGLTPAPPVEDVGVCGEYNGKPCTSEEFLAGIKRQRPVFPPNHHSTYSNNAFSLLGVVLERVAGKPYASILQSSIFDPLNMRNTSVNEPADGDARGVITPNQDGWGSVIPKGAHAPTGGIYSTTNDMDRYARYILSHSVASASRIANGGTIIPTLQWLHPAASTGANTFFGLSWEIYRPRILPHTSRPTELYTKGGGMPGYLAVMILLPEYGVGVTILTAGEGFDHFPTYEAAIDAVLPPLVRGLEEFARLQTRDVYAGVYEARTMGDEQGGLNSSIAIAIPADPRSDGIHVTDWISNGTDHLSYLLSRDFGPKYYPKRTWSMRLIPTGLFHSHPPKSYESSSPPSSPPSPSSSSSSLGPSGAGAANRRGNLRGESFRWAITPSTPTDEEKPGVLDGFCVTDVDGGRYAGEPLHEIVFWHREADNSDRVVEAVSIPSLRVWLDKREGVPPPPPPPRHPLATAESAQGALAHQKSISLLEAARLWVQGTIEGFNANFDVFENGLGRRWREVLTNFPPEEQEEEEGRRGDL